MSWWKWALVASCIVALISGAVWLGLGLGEIDRPAPQRDERLDALDRRVQQHAQRLDALDRREADLKAWRDEMERYQQNAAADGELRAKQTAVLDRLIEAVERLEAALPEELPKTPSQP